MSTDNIPTVADAEPCGTIRVIDVGPAHQGFAQLLGGMELKVRGERQFALNPFDITPGPAGESPHG